MVLPAPYGMKLENTLKERYNEFKEAWEERQGEYISQTYLDALKLKDNVENYQYWLKYLAQLDLVGVYRTGHVSNAPLRYTMSIPLERRINHRKILNKIKKFDVVARASGSVSLSGSHTVVFGQPALWMPISLYTFVAVRESPPTSDSLGQQAKGEIENIRKFERTFGGQKSEEEDIKKVKVGEKRRYCLSSPLIDEDHLDKINKLVEDHFDDLDRAYEFYTISEVPPSSGLGGSGSLAVALSLALHKFYNEITPEQLTLIDQWLSSWSKGAGLYNERTNLADRKSCPSKIKDQDGVRVKAPGASETYEKIRILAWKIENVLHGVSSGAAIHASMVGGPGHPYLYTPYYYAYPEEEGNTKPQQISDLKVGPNRLPSIKGIKNESNREGQALLRNIFQIAKNVKSREDLRKLERFVFDENTISLVGCGEEKSTIKKQEERDKYMTELYKNYADKIEDLVMPFLKEEAEKKGEEEENKPRIKEHLDLLGDKRDDDNIHAPLRTILRKKTGMSEMDFDSGEYLIDRFYKVMGIVVLSLLGEILRDPESSNYYKKRDQIIKTLDLTHQFLSTWGLSDYKLNEGATNIRSKGDFGAVMTGAGKSLLIFGDSSQMREHIIRDPRDNLRIGRDRVYLTWLYDSPAVSPMKIVSASDLDQESPSRADSKRGPAFSYINKS